MNKGKHISQAIVRLVLTLVILVLLNIVGNSVYQRFDLTAEKRFTLSDATERVLKGLDDDIYIKVYLEGDFPAGFKRLQGATEEMLYEFNEVSGGKIKYRFIDPSAGDKEERNILYKELYDKGLKPTNLRVKADEETSNKIIFPGLIMAYGSFEMPLQLLESQIGMGPEQVLNNSIELLEYKLANTLKKLTQGAPKRIGFIEGQGELDKIRIADFGQTLVDNMYDVRFVELPNTLSLVNKFETLIIAKPTKPFREQDKFKLDQFVMNGGSILWLIDQSDAHMDSLRGRSLFMAQDMDINLDDQLFKYGVRINKDLVQDIQCDAIPIVVSETNPPQTEFFPWPFFPIITSYGTTPESATKLPKPHVIAKNLDAVKTNFISTIDTIRVQGVTKTPILYTSQYSKALLLPTRLHLGMLKQPLNESNFKQSFLPVAYLLEGNFTSVFKNRLAPETLAMFQDSLSEVSFRDSGEYAKMIVVADGDIIANGVAQDGSPYPLGYNSYTKQNFANKDLLLNCIEYLTDEDNLIETRNREIKLRLLDKVKIKEQGVMYQIINLALPVLALLVFGFIYNFVRRRKYAA